MEYFSKIEWKDNGQKFSYTVGQEIELLNKKSFVISSICVNERPIKHVKVQLYYYEGKEEVQWKTVNLPNTQKYETYPNNK